MNNSLMKRAAWMLLVIAVVGLPGIPAYAAISGITGPSFSLTAKSGYISTAEGGSYLMWGYANGDGLMQYPGPTLIVNQGDMVTVNLTNTLTVPVSIVFPGQTGVVTAGGIPGLITNEAAAGGGTVTYRFIASQPGTYTYYSGTNPDLQIEMGLVGALIVRSSTPGQAYNHTDSQFDQEYLFLLTEMDPRVHDMVAAGNVNLVDTTTFFPVYWFINGRTAPDTMAEANAPWLPHQPYNCMPMTHPGERLLMRIVGAGRDMHPYHTHGNHHKVIAVDAKLLSSGAGADLAELHFTTNVVPGMTYDAIFTFTGEKLGWDMYGPIDTACVDANNDGMMDGMGMAMHCHDAACTDGNGDGFDDATREYCADHGKPFPVTLPHQQELTFGMFYGGSPFLGALGSLPPGEGGFNPNGGFFYMWHSHSEKELTNFDIFPGGMLTMMLVEAPGVMLMNP
ncbi:MAG: hypothetical protein A2078_11245 [Nitrospirae bacterium GWC2_57_9]|nr:MAG: hypothetical protein A2078_11245 [Nitrospirae bacterium GWC2_57_9]